MKKNALVNTDDSTFFVRTKSVMPTGLITNNWPQPMATARAMSHPPPDTEAVESRSHSAYKHQQFAHRAPPDRLILKGILPLEYNEIVIVPSHLIKLLMITLGLAGLMLIDVEDISFRLRPVPSVEASTDQSSSVMPNEEYQKLRDELKELVKQEDPNAALNRLDELMESDKKVLGSCHPLVHSIGHAGLEKYQNFSEAMTYSSEICNGGYIHGVLEMYFDNSDDISQDMQTVCNDYEVGTFVSWECYHGVGHGLMFYSNNNLPRALEYCREYTNDFAQGNCANGVFMENFGADQIHHKTKYVSDKAPFSPCETVAEDVKGSCYYYAAGWAMRVYEQNYYRVLKECRYVEKKYRDNCAQGVAGIVLIKNIDNPLFVQEFCEYGGSRVTDGCIGGMVGTYVNHFSSMEKAKELCPQLSKKNERTCKQYLEVFGTLF